MKETIIWSKDRCPYCDMAKDFFNKIGLEFEERNISSGDWTKEQLKEMVPNARTVPQIFINGEYVGGYTELQQYYEDHGMFNGNEGV